MVAKASTLKRNLTDRYLKSLKGGSKPYDVRDTEIRGLRIRVMPSGDRTLYCSPAISTVQTQRGGH